MSTDSIRTLAHPLRTFDPEDPDDTDLEALRDVIGAARVVCLGESAHHASELCRLRDRMLRFLVRELGFSAFVMESGLPESLAVDDWVRGGPGKLATIARDGITWAMGRCTETHTQLRWMRAHNATSDRPVGFYGMDVPGWLANPGPGVAACLARLEPRAADERLRAMAELGERTSAPAPDGSDVAPVPDGLADRLAELVERAEHAGDPLALRCAHDALRVVEFRTHGLYPGPGRNLRNEVMAENLRWIIGRERRVLVGAHNVHLQRVPSFDGTDPLGRLLGPELGDDLVVIGTTRATGPVPEVDPSAEPAGRYATSAGEPVAPPHSLDALLDTAGPLHLTDLRRAPPEAFAGITAMLGQHLLIDLKPREAFDAIVHVREITAVHGAADAATGRS